MVVLPWCATLQATLGGNSDHAQLVKVVMLLRFATLQVASYVTPFHALPVRLVVLRPWFAQLQATSNLNSVHALPVMVLLLLWYAML
jgi:hypothetical protein